MSSRFNVFVIWSFIVVVLLLAAGTSIAAATDEAVTNKICPVMKGQTNPDVFTEYMGKKVYFCCPSCIDTFNADPEKYIADLPQFASAQTMHTDHTMHSDQKMPAQTADETEVTNQYCPVMKGNKVDSSIFTEYKGKKVYFCCPSCIDAFNADPGKYLGLLPQFADVDASANTQHTEEEMHEHSSLAKYIVPAGITTFTVLILTVFTGYFRKLNPKAMFKWHKILGFVVLILAIIHALLVFLHD